MTANPHPYSFDSLDELVAEDDIRICIHNHGHGSSYDKIGEVLNAVKDHAPRMVQFQWITRRIHKPRSMILNSA